MMDNQHLRSPLGRARGLGAAKEGVVVEDYVHSWVKIPTLLAVRFACFALGIAGILATLRIAFGH
jgi:hypothetical protein